MKNQFLILNSSLLVTCLAITVQQKTWHSVTFEGAFITNRLVAGLTGTTAMAATSACQKMEGCHTVCLKDGQYYISEAKFGPKYCYDRREKSNAGSCWTTLEGWKFMDIEILYHLKFYKISLKKF